MRREFDFFDDEIIRQELDDLPAKDVAILITVMDHDEKVGFEDPKAAKVQDYGEGIKCIRHFKSDYKGRGLFYVGEGTAGYQKLWILTVYKRKAKRYRNMLWSAQEHEKQTMRRN